MVRSEPTGGPTMSPRAVRRFAVTLRTRGTAPAWPARRRARVGELRGSPTSSARGCSTRRSCAATGRASSAPDARACSTRDADRAEPGLLQLRRPLRRRGRRRKPRRARRPARHRGTGSSTRKAAQAASSNPTRTAAPRRSSPTTRASSSTGPALPAAKAARCTSPPQRPASGRSTGSRTSAGNCRYACTTRPTTTAT